MKANLLGTNTTVLALNESRLFNNGTLLQVNYWNWEDILLPIIKPGTKLGIYASYDSLAGAVNLDNIRYYTQQKYLFHALIDRTSFYLKNTIGAFQDGPS